jgi:hypothetical protein
MEEGDDMVLDQPVGSGIAIQEIIKSGIRVELFRKVEKQSKDDLTKLLFRQEKEHWPIGYTHRFFVEFDATSKSDHSFRRVEQQVLRAIALSRIIKPLPISINPTIVLESANRIELFLTVDFYGTAYVLRPDYYPETLTTADVDQMEEHWPAFEKVFDGRKTKFRRLHRAIMTFNDAHHIAPVEIRHVVMHSAMETLVCTSRLNNKNQVVKRLPKLVDGLVTEAEIGAAYDFCSGVKHAAEPSLLKSDHISEMHPDDALRLKSARDLDIALRRLFMKALDDFNFASLLEDKVRLENEFPV